MCKFFSYVWLWLHVFQWLTRYQVTRGLLVSVASEALASVASSAFAATVWVSARRSRHRRQEGPGLRGWGPTWQERRGCCWSPSVSCNLIVAFPAQRSIVKQSSYTVFYNCPAFHNESCIPQWILHSKLVLHTIIVLHSTTVLHSTIIVMEIKLC